MTKSVTIADRLCAGSRPFLVLPGMPLQLIHSGMLWCEGPCYFPALDTLIFSDIPNNQLLQWTHGLGTRALSSHADHNNGNYRDNDGRLISCKHLTHSVVRREHDGSITILASHFEGKPLNSPNDVVVSSDSAVWFTDPTYGILSDYEGQRRDAQQDACRVYRVDPVSKMVISVCDDVLMPNGLAFSPCETILYVTDSSRSHFSDGNSCIFAFDQANGRLSNQRTLFEIEHGVPDGIRVDEQGNLWCSSGRGIEVIDPDGNHIDHIPVPEAVSNLTFGGLRGNQLFITASSSVYSLIVGVRGARV